MKKDTRLGVRADLWKKTFASTRRRGRNPARMEKNNTLDGGKMDRVFTGFLITYNRGGKSKPCQQQGEGERELLRKEGSGNPGIGKIPLRRGGRKPLREACEKGDYWVLPDWRFLPLEGVVRQKRTERET